MSMMFISVILLIDTNIWIRRYETGLTWVIREITKLPGHGVWITGCVPHERYKPEYGGAYARTKLCLFTTPRAGAVLCFHGSPPSAPFHTGRSRYWWQLALL